MKKIFMMMAAALVSCNSFLDIKPNDVITVEDLTEENLEVLAAPLYNVSWFNFNNTFNIGIGDGMSYNIDHNAEYIGAYTHLMITSQTANLIEAWGSLYAVVQSANKAIGTFEESSVSSEKRQIYIAEARFFRSLAYWYLASLWGDVIISEDPAKIIANPIVNTHKRRDVWEFLLRDMEFAAKHLPETGLGAGRVNKYSAYAFLSRFYLDYSGLKASNFGENFNVNTRDAEYLELARKAAEYVIEKGPFGLLDNYHDVFKIESNNSKESVFAFQWVLGVSGGSNYGYTNSTNRYYAFHALEDGGGDAWGGWTNATLDVIEEFVDEGDYQRRYSTFMASGDYYPEINSTGGGFRLGDGSEGSNTYRVGDRSADMSNTCLNIKKGVTGNMKDNPAINSANSGLRNSLMRYSEVLINYADAVLGNNASTTDYDALEYFNQVRRRVGLAEKTSLTWEDIRRERRLEFCMEGRYWYDLLARSYYRQQEVIAILKAQDRGTVTPFRFDAPLALEMDEDRDPDTRATGSPSAATFRLPYPESDLIKNPLLDEPPVDFTFSEERITDLF